MNRYAAGQYKYTAGQSRNSSSRQAAPVQYRQAQRYDGYASSVTQWAAQVQPEASRFPATQRRPPENRHAGQQARQATITSANVEQWEYLRKQGYVLRGHPGIIDSHAHQYANTMTQQPSSISYAPSSASAWRPDVYSAGYSSSPAPPPLPSYNVHPHIRTVSHPKTTPRFPQPANAFMRAPARTDSLDRRSQTGSSPKRPPMKHRPSASTVRTLRGAVQLRPEQVFVYERPSKASYYQPDPVYASPTSLHQQSRAKTPVHQPPEQVQRQWDTRSTYTPSIRSISSRPQTPCQMINAQPAYPPTPAIESAGFETPQVVSRTPEDRRRSSDTTSRAGCMLSRKSRTLRRVETEQSCYSQQTYAEDYRIAMDTGPLYAQLEKAAEVQQPPLQTDGTEMSLGTCQRLWHELERELLVDETPRGIPVQAGHATPAVPMLEDAGEGSEYDFTEEIVPTQPLRPQLRRRKSSVYQYKGHDRAVDTLFDKARRASESASPIVAALQSSKPERPKQTSSTSMKQVATLRSALRKKTPAFELLENQAMRELKRQSAPSEADISEYGCPTAAEEESEDGSRGSGVETEDEYAESRTNSDTLVAESEEEKFCDRQVQEEAATAVQEEGGSEEDQQPEILAPRKLARLVKHQTRIPAPLSRRYADKLYASRSRIVKE